MATQPQCGCSSVSPFKQLAKAFSFSSSLPLMTFIQLVSLLLFAFLCLLSSAQSHTTQPLASSQQEQPSITKPFIYETVAASSPASSILMHANFNQNKEALLPDDGQDHASKEEAPIATPVFIYESVAASLSSRPRAEGSHLRNNAVPQDAEAALLDDGGTSSGKHVPSVARPSFIYESVAAALTQKNHGSTLLHESAQQEENAFLFDDGIGKTIMKEVAEPSYIFESVIAGSIPLRPPSHGSIFDNNVPQEENAFVLDDGTIKPIMQKKKNRIIAKTSFIYESVAASIHPEVHDAIRNNVPQEENGFLLDDGGMHVDSLKMGAKPITGKPFIYEIVAAQSPIGTQAGGYSHLRDNVSREENSALLDDGKHVHNGIKKEEPIKAEPVAASTHPGSPGGGLLQENVLQMNNVLLDKGGKHMHESPAAAVASNVPQQKYTFLHDDGHQKPISTTHHDGNNKALLIDTKPKEVKSQPLHHIDIKKSLNVQENESPAKAPASLLRNNVPQGKHAFLVDDGGIKHVEHDSLVEFSKELEVDLLHDIVAAQEKHGSLIDGGDMHAKEEEHVLHENASQGEYSSLLDDGGRKELHSKKLLKDKDDNKNLKKLPIYHELRLGKQSFNEENLRMVVGDSSKTMQNLRIHKDEVEGCPSKEESLRMVVGDSSNKMIQTGYKVQGNPSNEENLRMVVGDSSNKMIQTGYKVRGNPSNEENLRMVVGDSSKSMVQEGNGSPPKFRDNLSMVVDTSNNKIKKWHGRSRLCTNLPIICQQLAHAERMNHIALYGLLPTPTPEDDPVCCSGVCVDLSNDQLNCGSCGNACLLLQTCCNGECTDLNIDSSNCGQCDNSCPSSSPCQFGMCGYY